MSLQRNCILVSGLPGSGTGMITRILQLFGAELPESERVTEEESAAAIAVNPTIADVNAALFAAAGCRWDDWTTCGADRLTAEQMAAFTQQISDAIRSEFANSSIIILNDPRIARFLPLYLHILQSLNVTARCIHMTRNPFEPARSLERRERLPSGFSALIWLRHTLETEQATRNADRMFITYRDLMAPDEDAIRRLAEWGSGFGLSADAAVLKKAASQIRQFKHCINDDENWSSESGNALTELVMTTYQSIRSLAADPARADLHSVLDSNRAALNRTAAISGPGFRDLIARIAAMENRQKAKLCDQAPDAIETGRPCDHDASQLAALRIENEMLRATVTRLLRKPWTPLRHSLQHHGAMAMSKLLASIRPAQSAHYRLAAAKRDPQRFMAQTQFPQLGADPETLVPHHPPAPHMTTVVLPFASPLTHHRPQMRIAVLLHIESLDHARPFRDALNNMHVAFSVFITTDSAEKAKELRKLFQNGSTTQIQIRVLPASAQNIAPDIAGFAGICDRHDLLLVLHSAKHGETSSLPSDWRENGLRALLGSPQAIGSILDAFAAAPDLGMIAPPHLAEMRNCMDWGDDFGAARALAAHMGISLTTDSPAACPPGAMFWARPAAMAPLQKAIQTWNFAADATRPDGSFARIATRLCFYACEAAGLRWIYAGQRAQLTDAHAPLVIEKLHHLEWALSDQMPALLLPGLRPDMEPLLPPVDRLAAAHEKFSHQCQQDLDQFLNSADRLVFDQPETPPKLSVIVVLKNQPALTLHCLQSLHRDADLPLEVIILDDGSTAQTAALLHSLHGVTIQQCDPDLNVAQGINRAVQQAKGKHLLLLHSDTRILPKAIAKAFARLEDEADIGAVGGPVLLLDGTLKEAGRAIFINGSECGYGQGCDPGKAEFRFRRDVDACSHSFVMLRRALWNETGGLDETIAPAHHAHIDLCMRIWQNRFRVVYDPDVATLHVQSGQAQADMPAATADQRLLREKYGMALAERHFAAGTPMIRARQRRGSAPRILVLDDRVPIPNLGAGFPRAARILTEIGRAGWSCTFYPMGVPHISCEKAYQVIPPTTELSLGAPFVPLTGFLRTRVNCFDTVLVSRPHNMVQFRKAVAQVPGWGDVPVLYDAEAIFATRDAALARLGNTVFDSQKALADELALAKGVRTVFSVTQSEAEIFRDNGQKDVRVLGHALSPRPVGGGPEGRRNMLFVGALDNDNSPNTDSLAWFVRDIMPRIDAQIGTGWSLDVVGRAGAHSLQDLAGERVRILGMIQDLDPLYARARLFIAPTRYAAGIPMKVHEAASVGLPAVVTDILARQLGWTHGQTLLSAACADSFATCCALLYHDDALWARLRAEGLAAIRRDCAPATFSDTLRRALHDSLTRQTWTSTGFGPAS